jgi:hypothetical protein
MRTIEGGASRWAKAKDILRKLVGQLDLDDRAALVDCSFPATTLSALAPPPKLKPVIEPLEAGFGTGDVGDGLQEAVKLLSAKDLSGDLSIYIISDLQRQSCQRLDSVSVPQNMEVKIFPAGETNTPNVGISDLGWLAGRTPLQATVVSYAQEGMATTLDWVVDGRLVSSQPAVLPAHGTTNVTGSLPVLQPGWHQIEARLPSDDALVLDDTRCQILQVPVPLKVLCVEPRQTKHAFEEESFFLTSALQPEHDETNAAPSLFAIEKISPDALPGHLASGSGYQMVVLPALRELPAGCGPALLDFARNGGGVLLFVGDGIRASAYNSEFSELLPATLEEIEGDSLALENHWRLREFDTNSTVFSAFRGPRSGDLTLPEFWRRYALAPADSARVLARFRDSSPFLVSKEIGRGRVLLVNTSANTSWGDWPKHKTFVPWLHGVCHYLAGDELTLGPRPENSFIAGTRAELDLGVTNGNQNFLIHPPAGAEFTVKAGEQGTIELSLESPGFYAVANAVGQTVRMLAVNPPQRESDLTAFTATEVQTQLVRSQARPGTLMMAGMLEPVDGGTGLWRALMLAGGLFLVLETVLSNRTFA